MSPPADTEPPPTLPEHTPTEEEIALEVERAKRDAYNFAHFSLLGSQHSTRKEFPVTKPPDPSDEEGPPDDDR